MTGEIEDDDGVLVIRRIHVRYRLQAPAAKREIVERAFELHPDHCPVYRSLSPAIDITTELEVVEG